MALIFAMLQLQAQTPILGTYPATTITNPGGNAMVTPSAVIANAASVTAATSANFKGQLLVNPVSGIVAVTNASPAGTYTVNIKASNGVANTTTSFVLTIGNAPCSQGTFVGTTNIAAGTSPRFIAVGDFNSDGKTDFVAANATSNNVTVKLGDGSGGFGAGSTLTVGTQPFGVAVADFNNDGKLDFVVSNNTSYTVSIRMGNGAGAFPITAEMNGFNFPRGIVTGDFNGDGNQDFAVVSETDNKVAVRLGNGNGTFTQGMDVPVGTGPGFIAAGDFNGDNKIDFAVTNETSSTISIRQGDGAGGFAGTADIFVGNMPTNVVIADFNNDGKQDFATANFNNSSVSVRLGNGMGGFTGSSNFFALFNAHNIHSLAVGDFNGDGNQDLAAANYGYHNVLIKLGDGTGNFYGTTSVATGNYPIFLAVADFNSDGRQDFVTTNYLNSSFSLRLGTPEIADINVLGNNTLIPLGSNMASTLDNTDFGDVATSLTRSFTIRNPSTVPLTVTAIRVTGADSSLFVKSGITLPSAIAAGASISFNLTFSPTSAGTKTARVTIGNDDCDKALYDFAIRANGVVGTVTLGTYPASTIATAGGNLLFAPSVAPVNAGSITAFTTIDFKGLLSVNPSTGKILVTNAHPAGVYSITVKAAGTSSVTQTFSLTVNSPQCSKGLFNTTGTFATGSGPYGLAIADFNGDGKQDMVAANYGSPSVSVSIGNGSGGVASLTSVAMGANVQAIAITDFNGDGQQDFVAANYNGNTLFIKLGNGLGGFVGNTGVVVGNNPYALAVGDINGDGKQDILTANYSGSVSVLLGDGAGGFTAKPAIAMLSTPTSIATSDFNGDGILDFATVNGAGNNVSIRLGNGAGGFTTTPDVAVGTNPQSLMVADLNNDGKQDLAVANTGGNTVSIRMGNGNGGFNGTLDVAVGTNPYQVAAGDFNGDGKQDIATANAGSNTVSIRLGDGSGGFTGATNMVVGSSPRSVAIGDLNGDGKQDIVSGNYGNNTLSIRLGIANEINIQGNGINIPDSSSTPTTANFTDFASFIVGTSFQRVFAIQNTGTDSLMISSMNLTGTDAGSFNLSGLPLPVTLPAGATKTFTATFSPLTTGLKTAFININNDDCDESLYDYVIQGTATPAPTIGTYAATVISSPGGNATVVPSAAPVGALALTASTSTNFKGLLRVDPVTGIVTVTNAHPAGTYTISVGTASTSVSTFLLTVNNSICRQPLFATASKVPAGNGPKSLAVGDFNGDGKQDLAITNDSSNTVSIRLGDGSGAFTGTTNIQVGLNPRSIAIGDFNGDGKTDFATANYTANTVSIRLGDGTGGFIATNEVAVATNPNCIVVGDFNGDGRQDIATTNYGSANVSIRLGDGAGNFYGSGTVTAGTNPWSLALGDFNNDGKQDLLVANFGSNTVSVRMGDGSGAFTGSINIAVGANPKMIFVSDFNGDGKQDFAVANSNAASVSIRLGDGTGGFSGTADIATGPSPEAVAVGDFNGDGKQDIAVSKYGGNSYSVCLGDGLGGFAGTSSYAIAGLPTSIAVGDFNADGLLDIALATFGNRSVAVLLGGTNDINLSGNTIAIADGSSSPSIADGTDFGTVGSKLTRNFIIKNTGSVPLTIPAVNFTGPDAAAFTSGGINFPDTIAVGDSAILQISFLPNTSGLKTAVVNIVNDDCDEALYDFAIQAMGMATVTTIGNYAPVTIATAGGNATTLPTVSPANAAAITATTSPNFKGTLLVDPITGKVTITNASPAGTYTIKLGVSNGFSTANTSFVLTINNAACSQALFTAAPDVAVGNSPRGMVVGDFNNDGIQDIMVGYTSDKNVSIRLGNGNGGFVGAAVTTLPANPNAIAAGDFNGDGYLDFAATFYSGTIAIRLGDGLGHFSGTGSVGSIQGCYALAVGDLNNDGGQDIVVTNTSTSMVYGYLGNGSGSFSLATATAVGSNPFGIVMADFNGDGKLDFATANYAANNASVRFGNGAGGFTGTTTVLAGSVPFAITAADFNGDGNQDIAIANAGSGNVSVRFGNGAGVFTGTTNLPAGDAPLNIAAGDFNGDGKQDILSSNGVTGGTAIVSVGNGLGGFTVLPAIGTMASNYFGLAVGDFNSDGLQDFVVDGMGNTLGIWLGNSNEIDVFGNNISIADNNATPSFTDSTDYGHVSSQSTRSYKIKNTGMVKLGLSGLGITGPDSAMFKMIGPALPVSLAPGDSASFSIRFIPTAVGIRSAMVTILNDDCDEAVYNFMIQGMGVGNTPVLGTYLPTVITKAGGNTMITPSVAPASTVNITAQAGASFKGVLHVDPITGILYVTNARPAGIYTVKVKAMNGFASFQRSFTLTVNPTGCTQGDIDNLVTLPLTYKPVYIALGDFNGDGRQDFAAVNQDNALVAIKLGYGTGGFGGTTLVPVGNNPKGIVVADFNGDGKQDFATANYGATTASVRMGNGLGGFTGTIDIQVAGNPLSLATGDFNSDGKPDLAVANFVGSSVSIRLGDGDGGFTGNLNVSVGSGPYSIITSDFNGDGNEDFATTNHNTNAVSIRFGDGNGGFTGTTEVAVGTNPFSIATGDFNGDGKQDFVTANFGSNNLSIRLGNGAGGFVTAADLVSVGRPVFVAVADLNGDGRDDIIESSEVANKGTIRFGNGDGSFAAASDVATGTAPYGIAVGDFDGDGKQDFVVANYSSGSVSVRMGKGKEIEILGNNQMVEDGDNSPSILDHTDFGQVVWGDSVSHNFVIRNKGGIEDTVTAITMSGADSALFSVRGISFPLLMGPGSSYPFNIAFSAKSLGAKTAVVNIINDDCDEANYDIALGANVLPVPTMGIYPASIAVKSNGTSSVVPVSPPSGGYNLFAGTTSRFKGSLAVNPVTGVVTITNAHPAGTYNVKVGLGAITTSFMLTVDAPACSKGNFKTGPLVNVGTTQNSVAVGDFNGDGKQDFATANYATDSVSIQLGNGLGSFTAMPKVSVGSGPASIAVADFNGDGKQDFITCNIDGISVRLGNGQGGFAQRSDLAIIASVRLMTIGDFNNDGKPDFIVPKSSGIAVELGDGKGGFFDAPEVAVNQYPISVSIGDVDNDGNVDMVTCNYNNTVSPSSSTISVRLGDGHGGFGGGTNIVAGNYPYSSAIQDFNNDGSLDLALTNYNSNTVSLLLGNGSGNFVLHSNVTVGSNPKGIVAGDFNGDGDHDFATANYGSNTVSIRLGDGSGGFLNNGNLVASAGLNTLAVGDLNGDGRQDLVATSNTTTNAVVLINLVTNIDVKGNNAIISNRDTVPSLHDYTDFGQVAVGSVLARIFTITNKGTDSLKINNIKISGNDSAMFVMGGIIFPYVIKADSSRTFTIAYTPTSVGVKTAKVVILSDGCTNSSYLFAIQGADTQPGAALDFDGINDHIIVNNTTGNMGTGAVTISAYIKTSATTKQSILSKRDACSTGNFMDFASNAAGHLSFELVDSSNASQVLTGAKTINDGQWHQVTAVRNSTTLALYVDGMLDTTTVTAAVANINNTAPLLIGATACNVASNFFVGQMDELRFWNKALSLCDIHNKIQCELTDIPLGLLAYFRFNQGRALDNNSTIISLTDSSGGAINGTLTNFNLNGPTSNWIAAGAVATGSICNNTNIWLGLSADWDAATNWSLGSVPTGCTPVVINPGVPFMPEISSPNASCFSLQLNSGAIITIKGTGKINITGLD